MKLLDLINLTIFVKGEYKFSQKPILSIFNPYALKIYARNDGDQNGSVVKKCMKLQS